MRTLWLSRSPCHGVDSRGLCLAASAVRDSRREQGLASEMMYF